MSLNLIKYENKSPLNENETIADINKVTADDMNQIKTVINDLIFPVGSIIMNVSSSFDPNSVYGGTWEQWAKGQVPVGVDKDQTEFDTVEKTGGNKYTEKHEHTFNNYIFAKSDHVNKGTVYVGDGQRFVTIGNSLDNIGIGIESGQARMRGSELTDGNLMTDEFGTGESGNLQPYITCYYWKRVA